MQYRHIEAMADALVRAGVPPCHRAQVLAGLREFWAEHGIALVWSVEDVLRLAPGLTRGEGKIVLGRVLLEHDRDRGVTNDTVVFAATSLFGEAALGEGEDDE